MENLLGGWWILSTSVVATTILFLLISSGVAFSIFETKKLCIYLGPKLEWNYLLLQLTKTQWQVPISGWVRIGSMWASIVGVQGVK